MATETGKQRSQRIQIDYYRQRTGLQRFRTICVLLGLLGAAAYAAYVAFAARSHLSTGPLASVHASFENDCERCHGFTRTPMDPQGSKIDLSWLGIRAAQTAANIETACQKCHRLGDHHRDKMSQEWTREDRICSSCHADHQGRDHDLTLVSSQRCVSCHADLAAGCRGTPRVRSNVTGFDKESHGDFASLAVQDPGTVSFDHAQHLHPGQVDADKKGGFTIGQLPPPDRDRYRVAGQNDSSLVTLDCSSCHVLAGSPDDGELLNADHELGRYIRPISFDRHCSACHALNPGVASEDSTPLPHAVPWRQVHLLLAANANGAEAVGLARRPRDDSQSVPLPGESRGVASVPENAAPSFDLTAARDLVEAKCLQCHDRSTITDESITASHAPGHRLIPSRWLKHGLYDHAAHRKIDCRFCHAAAYASDQPGGTAEDHKQVMIAGIDSCTPCHRSEEVTTPSSLNDAATSLLIDGQPTWASDQCTLCHRYHAPHGLSAGLPRTALQSAAVSQEASP